MSLKLKVVVVAGRMVESRGRSRKGGCYLNIIVFFFLVKDAFSVPDSKSVVANSEVWESEVLSNMRVSDFQRNHDISVTFFFPAPAARRTSKAQTLQKFL